MGDLSQLLAEIAQAPDEGDSWREALRPGDEVGRYRIRREIGRGGFGAVYEAFDPELGRTVALKALKPGRTRRIFSEEWIRKEAEAVAKLDHPAIVTIHDVGTCPAGAYLVMELLQGETLAERIAKGPLPVDEALRIAEQMAEGLAHAHSRGVLHRDLKPANVFLCADGRVKLLDFGLAHLLGTEGSSGAGTPAYMAPEQAAGRTVDERADVYAAAMVLGEMLTGRRPVERATPRGPSPEPPSSKTELMWVGEKAPRAEEAPAEGPKLEGMPRPVARVVKAALAANPEERPKDGGEWLAELRSARRRVEQPRRIRRIAIFATAFVTVGLAVAGLATWRVWERQIPGGRPTVAVADFANETGEKELDSISGLLITSLEQGTQLRVLTRGRMLDLLRQLGKGDVTRIDEPLAREVGTQARANALLLASIRKLGATYVVEMRALDPLHDEYVFTTREQASAKEAVFQLVDRLAATTRKKLGVIASDAPHAPPIAAITTGNAKAWDLLFQARQALDRNRVDESVRLASAAVEADPGFALAHYQLAVASAWHTGEGKVEYRRHVEDAERLSDRLPEKERLLLRAMRAALDLRWEEAMRLGDQLADAYPVDKEVVAHAGDIRFHIHHYADCVPYFQRALKLDPDYLLVRNHLLVAVANVPDPQSHLDWLRGEAARSANEADDGLRLEVIGDVLLVAGSEEDALAAYRRSVDRRSAAWPPRFYARYLSAQGRAVEAEAMLRTALAESPPSESRSLKLALVLALQAQGRLAESRPFLEEIGAGMARRWIQVSQGAVAGSASVVRRAVENARRDGMHDDPGSALEDASLLVEFGLLPDAARVVTSIRSNPRVAELWPVDRLQLDLIDAWSRGDLEGAESVARKAAAAAPDVNARLATHLQLGLVQIARNDCAGAVTSLESARLERSGFFYTLASPRILHALALCYEQTGRPALARDRIEELLRLWNRADRDLPRLAEAKAIQVRLVAAAGDASAK